MGERMFDATDMTKWEVIGNFFKHSMSIFDYRFLDGWMEMESRVVALEEKIARLEKEPKNG